MAANACAICGTSINIMQRQQLADGNYICRKTCKAKGLKEMDYGNASLAQVNVHLAQVERGTKLWHHYFIPRLKPADKSQRLHNIGQTVYVATDIGLMALVNRRFKFFIFGKTEHACVYRIADLVQYEYIPDNKTDKEGKSVTDHNLYFYFQNVDGLSHFKVKLSSPSECDREIKYFNKLFGIQKTVGNIKTTWKDQVSAIKDTASGLKAMMSDADDAGEKMGKAVDSLNRMEYGDRTELIAKADAALNAFQG